MKKKYKIWMHLEEITLDENSNDVDYKSLDDEELPLPLEIHDNREEAVRIMNQFHKIYCNK